MNLEVPKLEIKSATRVTGGPATPRKGPPKFKQRQTRQFKSKPPKKGIQGFGDDIPGMEGLGTDITVICPWEAFNHLELSELANCQSSHTTCLLMIRTLFWYLCLSLSGLQRYSI
uniref:Retinal rod rhodopsin-sensitive cGMP 3',5'-cyclic phosphodiesterase subunit gamma n=1 Tax=Hucho hucho TaxID=62062 RepID=A0A4W5MHW2_9TELE